MVINFKTETGTTYTLFYSLTMTWKRNTSHGDPNIPDGGALVEFPHPVIGEKCFIYGEGPNGQMLTSKVTDVW